ncbi:MAG: DUF2141 domain-containing protein [Calditrichia bacterium]
MKLIKITNMLLIFCLLPLAVFSQDAPVEKSESRGLTVKITGLKNDRGKVMIALCNSEENFSSHEEVFRGAAVEVVNKEAQAVFKDIPPGEYAVKVFHDQNENGKMDTNFLGIPREKYGFSNNAKGKFGPPKWKDAKFDFVNPDTTLEIRLN